MSLKKSKRAKVMALMAIKNQKNKKVHRVQLRDTKDVYNENKKEFQMLYHNLHEETIPKMQLPTPSLKINMHYNTSKPEKQSTVKVPQNTLKLKPKKKSIKIKVHQNTLKSELKPPIPPVITPNKVNKHIKHSSQNSNQYRNCPACTFQNKSSNTKCEICETPFYNISNTNKKRKRNEMQNISNTIETANKKRKIDENIWSQIADKVQHIVFESDLNILTKSMVLNSVKNELNLSEEQITFYRKQIKKTIKELAAIKSEHNQSICIQPKTDMMCSLKDTKYLKEYEMICRKNGIINNIPSLEKQKQFLFCINRNIKADNGQIGYFVLFVDSIHLHINFDYGAIQNQWKCGNCNVMNDMSFVFCSECTMDKCNGINSFKMTEMDYIWLKVVEHTEYGVLGNLSAKCSTNYGNNNWNKKVGEIMIFADDYSDEMKMLNIIKNIRSFCDYKKGIKFKIKSNGQEMEIYSHSIQHPNKLVEIG